MINDKQECGCDKCHHKLCTHKVPIFSALEPSELSAVIHLIVHKSYMKGEQIVSEGQPLDSLIIINDGLVKAFKYSQEGKEQILYILSPGDFFGEKNLLKDQVSTFHVQALEGSAICMIHKNEFRKLLGQHPSIGLKVIEALSERIETLEGTIENMGTKTIEYRVNSVLLEFAKKHGVAVKKGIEFDLPLSREGIANYIGVTRETVSRKLSLLQEEGIIELSGHKRIIVLDQKRLES